MSCRSSAPRGLSTSALWERSSGWLRGRRVLARLDVAPSAERCTIRLRSPDDFTMSDPVIESAVREHFRIKPLELVPEREKMISPSVWNQIRPSGPLGNIPASERQQKRQAGRDPKPRRARTRPKGGVADPEGFATPKPFLMPAKVYNRLLNKEDGSKADPEQSGKHE